MSNRRKVWEFRNRGPDGSGASGKNESWRIVGQKAETAIKGAIREAGFWKLRATANANGGESKVSYIFNKISGGGFGPMSEDEINKRIFHAVFPYEKDKTFCEAIILDFLLQQYSQDNLDFRRMGADAKREALVYEIKRCGNEKIIKEGGMEVRYHTPLQLIDDGALPALARHIAWRYGHLLQLRPEKISEVRKAISLAKKIIAVAIDEGITYAASLDGLTGILLNMGGRIGHGLGNPYYRIKNMMPKGNCDPERAAHDLMYLVAKLRNYVEFNSELMWIWDKIGEEKMKKN